MTLFPAGSGTERIQFNYDSMAIEPGVGYLSYTTLKDGYLNKVWTIRLVSKLEHPEVRIYSYPSGTLSNWLESDEMFPDRPLPKVAYKVLSQVRPYAYYQWLPMAPIASAFWLGADGKLITQYKDEANPQHLRNTDANRPIGSYYPITSMEREYLKQSK